MQFRAEAFNMTNTPHFANPSGNGTNVSQLQLNNDGSVRNLAQTRGIAMRCPKPKLDGYSLRCAARVTKKVRPFRVIASAVPASAIGSR